jgi:hypothetical protein
MFSRISRYRRADYFLIMKSVDDTSGEAIVYIGSK